MDFYTEYIIGENRAFILTCLIIASVRIYLEIIDFDFENLPLSKSLKKHYGAQKVRKFHKVGLYLSISQIALFAPQFLFMN